MVFLPRPLARGQETLPGTEEGLESLLISPFQRPLPGCTFYPSAGKLQHLRGVSPTTLPPVQIHGPSSLRENQASP